MITIINLLNLTKKLTNISEKDANIKNQINQIYYSHNDYLLRVCSFISSKSLYNFNFWYY